jgi:hypothetical protein
MGGRKTAVRPVAVVLMLPVPDHHLRFEERVELLDRQQLVALTVQRDFHSEFPPPDGTLTVTKSNVLKCACHLVGAHFVFRSLK